MSHQANLAMDHKDKYSPGSKIIGHPEDAACSEVADFKRIEHQLRKEKIAAEEEVRNYVTFLASNAHDIRSPLTAIRGYAEMMQSGLHLSEGEDLTVEYAGNIITASHHLMHLINDLLDLCRLDAEKLELRNEPISVKELIENASVMVRERAFSANIEFVISISPGLQPVYLDGQRMTQAIVNLLSNAIKFTPSGGRIDLGVERGKNDELILRVQDTGVGMKKEDIPKALMEFGQVGYGHDQSVPSSGLGLPLARRLVELHQGTLNVRSELGQGTTITLTLPPTCWHSAPANRNFV